MSEKRKKAEGSEWSVQKLVFTAMLCAAAGVLMSLEFSVPLMPVFYKIDFSDVPSFIALFTMGPVSGLAVEIVKILIKLITVGTNSNYVGEFSNLIGAFLFILPIWFISRKTGIERGGMIKALVLSGIVRIAWSCFCNAYITLPMYAASMGISIDDVVKMVSAANPAITDLRSFIILATVPFNLLKMTINYVIGFILYHRVVPVIPYLNASAHGKAGEEI